jgi:hypothetical protein
MGSPTSGNKRDKLIRDALMIAVNRVQEGDPQGRKKLAIAAAAVVEKAVEGDLAAFREIADRIDGKAHQSLDVTSSREVSISELTDAELVAIIANRAGSAGVAEAPQGKAKPH